MIFPMNRSGFRCQSDSSCTLGAPGGSALDFAPDSHSVFLSNPNFMSCARLLSVVPAGTVRAVEPGVYHH